MTRAKLALWSLAAGLLAAGAACADMGRDDADASAPSNGIPGGDGGGSGADESPAPGAAATGVVLVHAASFPSFRLCFENYPDLPPQPDSKVMPEANVVGVEIGSLVRIDPLDAPGRIFVVHESKVRGADATCGERLGTEIGKTKTPRMLTKNNDYHVLETLDVPLGKSGVQVLAITGCGSEAFLDSFNATSDKCGEGWTSKSGNLRSVVVDLWPTSPGASETELPVQLFHMAPAVDALTGPSGQLEVSFGPLGEDDGQPVPAGSIFSGGEQTSLSVDQTNEAFYGSHGFRIVMSSPDASLRIEQSLAAVQELSAPRDVPTSYYRAASNYALLLLGDPAHRPTLADGGANEEYNPRQAVHLLAVPVLDPDAPDGGAEPESDAGADTTTDGG